MRRPRRSTLVTAAVVLATVALAGAFARTAVGVRADAFLAMWGQVAWTPAELDGLAWSWLLTVLAWGLAVAAAARRAPRPWVVPVGAALALAASAGMSLGHVPFGWWRWPGPFSPLDGGPDDPPLLVAAGVAGPLVTLAVLLVASWAGRRTAPSPGPALPRRPRAVAAAVLAAPAVGLLLVVAAGTVGAQGGAPTGTDLRWVLPDALVPVLAMTVLAARASGGGAPSVLLVLGAQYAVAGSTFATWQGGGPDPWLVVAAAQAALPLVVLAWEPLARALATHVDGAAPGGAPQGPSADPVPAPGVPTPRTSVAEGSDAHDAARA